MPIYTGSTADGSDMRPAEGMYINPDNPNQWSNMPYPAQRREERKWRKLINHIDGVRTIMDEIVLIRQKRSKLPKSIREYTLNLLKDEQLRRSIETAEGLKELCITERE